jgi:putative salt-induced outer membrane protein YdiY
MARPVARRPKEKFWPGQEVPKTACYGQYHDKTEKYAGAEHDHVLKNGYPFPRALKDHHFREK